MTPLSGFRSGLAGLAIFLAQAADAQVTLREDAVGKLLNEWAAAGTAAGLAGITYENRDGQHSALNTAQYPQLQVFKPDAKTGPPTGPAVMLRMVPTVGNCSMSAAPDKGGSLPRMYQSDPQGQKFLMMQYLANNLMIYPEHQDYDIGGNGVGGYGDLYPANNACTLISQGSSGSDQPFLNAVMATLAAFPPETQQVLVQKRILMPTLQSIFRQSNRQVKKQEDYFTGAAHPVVFDATSLDEEKMVKMAQAMKPPMIPPLVQMEVLEETEMLAGKEFFEAEKERTWKLADTPVSIARVLRTSSVHEMTISARKSADLMGRPVQLRWQVLQGDPRLVKMEQSGKEPVVKLTVSWQPPMTATTGIRSHRVDIGLFATNGISVSAPAIVSFYMLPNEMRFHDSNGRLEEICYQTHNPEMGLPAADRDPRWLKAMRAVSLAGDGLRSRLMEKLLTEPERRAIQELWQPLDGLWQQVQRLEAEPDANKKAQAETHTQKERLLDGIAKVLATPLPSGTDGQPGRPLRSAIVQAFDGVLSFVDLYPSFHREVLTLASQSSKPSAAADIRQEVQRQRDLNVFFEDASGAAILAASPDQLTAAERHYLRGLNLTILSQALFPEVLERSPAPAWVDARLSTPKAWRDIYRYDREGKALGWIRHQGQKMSWFSTEGKLLPEGPGKPELSRAVTYGKNAQGLLEWRSE